ncbi:MAG: hypothetical protein VYB79_01750, partial [Chloroflexota bacterium]|nr:hypothetical protein [Chloroflexota bacterium]
MYKFLLLISLLFSLIACDTVEKVSLDNQSNIQELPIANNIQDQEQMRMEKEEQMRMEKEEQMRMEKEEQMRMEMEEL